MTKDDKKVLDDQIRRWTTEMNDLAGKIAVAKGTKGTKGMNTHCCSSCRKAAMKTLRPN